VVCGVRAGFGAVWRAILSVDTGYRRRDQGRSDIDRSSGK
jgi:hypothetical protein